MSGGFATINGKVVPISTGTPSVGATGAVRPDDHGHTQPAVAAKTIPQAPMGVKPTPVAKTAPMKAPKVKEPKGPKIGPSGTVAMKPMKGTPKAVGEHGSSAPRGKAPRPGHDHHPPQGKKAASSHAKGHEESPLVKAAHTISEAPGAGSIVKAIVQGSMQHALHNPNEKGGRE